MFQKQAIKTSQKNRIKFLLCSVKNVNSFKSDIVKPFGTHLLGQSLLKKDKIEITSQCRLIVYLKSTDSLLLNNLYWIALDNNSEILQNQNLFYHRNTKNLLLWHSILTPLKLLVHPSRLWKPFGVFFLFWFLVGCKHFGNTPYPQKQHTSSLLHDYVPSFIYKKSSQRKYLCTRWWHSVSRICSQWAWKFTPWEYFEDLNAAT